MPDTPPPTHDVAQIVTRLPPRTQRAATWVLGSWLGRILHRSATQFRRSEVLDRSMGIATEVFTSIFPILILAAVWVGSGATDAIAETIGLPNQTRAVLLEAVSGTDASVFGLVGSLILLVSATSLSRAIGRAFAAIWGLPRIRTGLRQAWRLPSAVFILVCGMILIRWLPQLTNDWPVPVIWRIVVPLGLITIVGVLLPWILLSGAVPARRLVPGALLFGSISAAFYPASRAFLAGELEESAARYGTIGVAFTYIALLYSLTLCFLGAAFVGQIVATDDGRLGRWIREEPASASRPVTPSAAPGPDRTD